MYSREKVLGSNPTTLKILAKAFAAPRRVLTNAPSKGLHSRYITLFGTGTHSVVSFFELLAVSLAVLMHFLR